MLFAQCIECSVARLRLDPKEGLGTLSVVVARTFYVIQKQIDRILLFEGLDLLNEDLPSKFKWVRLVECSVDSEISRFGNSVVNKLATLPRFITF